MSVLLEYVQENGIEALNTEYAVGIRSENRGDGKLMYCVSYNQIETPKNEITNMCRGAIITQYGGKWEYMARPFDRFFNFREGSCVVSEDDLSGLDFYKKHDGSIIKVWWNYYSEQWQVSTNKMIFANGENMQGFRFMDLFNEAWNEDYYNDLDRDYTYIFELCSNKNRVVKRYQDTKLYLLAVRHNYSGSYTDVEYELLHAEMKNLSRTLRNRIVKDLISNEKGIQYLPPVQFKNLSEIQDNLNKLEDLDEGYVGYTQWGVPVVKFKTGAYLAAHRIKGEGLTPKRAIELVIINEHEEYLSVFEEDKEYFQPFISAYQDVLDCTEQLLQNVILDVIIESACENMKKLSRTFDHEQELTLNDMVGWVASNKEYVDMRSVAQYCNNHEFEECKHLVFTIIKNGCTVLEAFNKLTQNGKIRLVEGFVE